MGRVADVGEEDVGEEVHIKSMGKMCALRAPGIKVEKHTYVVLNLNNFVIF